MTNILNYYDSNKYKILMHKKCVRRIFILFQKNFFYNLKIKLHIFSKYHLISKHQYEISGILTRKNGR